MNEGNYLARATRYSFGDRTVWWRMLVLWLAALIPFLGEFFFRGYCMVLMRHVAWDVGDDLPNFADASEILTRGVHGFVVSFLIGLPAWIAMLVMLISGFFITSRTDLDFSGPVLSEVLSFLASIPMILIAPLLWLALLRSAMYQTIGSGLSLSGLKRLVSSDPAGFWSIAWAPVAGSFISVAVLATVGMLYSDGLLTQLAAGLVLNFILFPLQFIFAAAFGLWARHTDPTTWPPLHEPKQAETPVSTTVEAQLATEGMHA